MFMLAVVLETWNGTNGRVFSCMVICNDECGYRWYDEEYGYACAFKHCTPVLEEYGMGVPGKLIIDMNGSINI